MEIGEAAALADQFSLSLVFKVHSLPLNERTSWARQWRLGLGTSLGVRAALEEQRRNLKPFAALRLLDRDQGRQMFVTLSALVDDDGRGRCPAVSDGRCSIYARRPLTCRSVPLHYSRAPSTLASYLDGFTSTPSYRCETTVAPPVLSGDLVLCDAVRSARDEAFRQADRDKAWKTAVTGLMGDPLTARDAGLPTLSDVMTNSDRGYATSVPMLAAWRVALANRMMTRAAFDDVCRRQIALLARFENKAEAAERQALYRAALSADRSPLLQRLSLAG
ncbi:MAG: YkgJ family cysteine cluster protein [Brevundimonas sp.]|uniref:YkgJ family cysteine cluster protein n=1 Tax=Brevundimonas sp. TaxID=1871086 RepID=UPI0028D18BE0|nr:YkgJ family cysteine cluster protein [uncultured Brevundimonas sp.]